jgi:SAM-dependent methyltransferase
MIDYHLEYEKLPFEDKLRNFRYSEIKKRIDFSKVSRVLEVGCGSEPFYSHIDFDGEYVFCEPSEFYLGKVNEQFGKNRKVSFILGALEDRIQEIKNIYDDFDVIIIGGFLHEIDAPGLVLESAALFCHANTKVISFVPNANSFHRLLALETKQIQSIYEFSEYDVRFGRRVIFNSDTFRRFFEIHHYHVLEVSSYFIKIFSHQQMEEMLQLTSMPKNLLEGFNQMVKYLPDMGAELLVVANYTNPSNRV